MTEIKNSVVMARDEGGSGGRMGVGVAMKGSEHPGATERLLPL